MPFDFTSLLGPASSIVGGLMRDRATERNNERQIALSQQQMQLQRDFAENGISWRVADAERAGVHPLFALGASTHSFSPVSVGTTAPTGLGEGVASAGQDLGRALHATSTASDRAATAANAALTLQRGKLENESLALDVASKAARLKGQVGPAMPTGLTDTDYEIPGQGPTVKVRPFRSGEERKVDDRPQLGYGGRRWGTDPGTVNMQKTEDRYGDEGPMQWLFQTITGWNDLKHNVDSGNLTRKDTLRWILDNARWIDRNTDIGFGRFGPRSR